MNSQQLVTGILWGGLAGATGGFNIASIWRNHRQMKKLSAEAREALRKAENPELPGHIADCLRRLADETAGMPQGRRLAGQVLADKLRTTVTIPDMVLAAVMHDVLWMVDRLLEPECSEEFRARMLADILTAAAVDLSALERELTPR